MVDRPHGQSIRDTIALAQYCEGLGYHRFWVSEHHNHGTIAGTAPEILIAAIASLTTRIRVGSAGVMLPHYSPLKVAEQFLVLEAIAPGRIDLGLGRAPGSDGRTAFALNPLANERPAQFPNDVRDLMAWVSGAPLPDGHPFKAVKAYPWPRRRRRCGCWAAPTTGRRWRRTSGCPTRSRGSSRTARAGRRRSTSTASSTSRAPRHPEPHTALCVWALAAETEEEAQFHFSSRAHVRLLRDRGIFAPLEPPAVAAAHPYTEAEAARITEMRKATFVGTGTQVAERIADLAKRLDVQEMAVVTWAYDEAARRASYRLLAEAMGLARVGA